MKRAPAVLLGSAAVAAMAAYAFHPSLGRQRRHRLKDRASHAVRRTRQFGDVAARDIRNRARGAQAQVARIAQKGAEVNDEVLAQRVRAKLGRYVSHPKAITVTAAKGSIDLSGDVLEQEHRTALKALSAVRGVQAVEDRLILHRSADLPSLQGGKAPVGEPGELGRRNWAPAIRVGAGCLGLAMLTYASAGRGRLRLPAAIIGCLMLARAITNQSLSDLPDRPLDAREVPLAPHPERGAWSIEES